MLVPVYCMYLTSRIFCVCSEWRLVHKGSTYFGPRLWLDVRVDRPMPVTFQPPILTATTPALSASNTEEVLTNENLLKSIGFIPSTTSLPPDEAGPSIKMDSECSESNSGMMTSTDQLLQTFEMIEDPGCSEDPVSEEVKTTAFDSDFVMIIPDCFDLEKPLPDFSPPTSLSHVVDSSLSLGPYQLEPNESHDSHMTSTSCEMPLAAPSSSPMPLPPPYTEVDDPQMTPVEGTKSACPPQPINPKTPNDPKDDKDTTPSASPSVRRSSGFAQNGLTLRALKGGLYKNPVALTTRLVNTVSGFVDDKVHFSSAAEKTERKPTIKFATPEASSCESSDEEEFEVRNINFYFYFLCNWHTAVVPSSA